jgi:NAD(P)-dependent dehydrogenase (short-subunit alcohol dehydrogenase family)
MKRVALVTGAAGGIGAATARIFLKYGWTVVGVDRNEMPHPRGLKRFVCADVTKPDTHNELFEDIQKREGQLDALVNNAAVQVCKPLIDMQPEEWDMVMDCNLKSTFYAVKTAYPLLKANRGAIVNVSSVHALSTSENIAAYAASKGALLALTRAMALEFGPDIRVNTVLPGAVNTPMLHEGLQRSQAGGKSLDNRLKTLGDKHALKRVGQPEDIARAVLFLADNDQSAFMTGQSLVVDGGATARLSTE